MKTVGAVFGGLAVLALLIVGGYAFSWFAAPWQGALEKRQEVQSGDFRLQAYEEFFKLCKAANRQARQVETLQTQLDNAESSHERQRIRQQIAGNKAQLQNTISEYNQKSAMEGTRGQFKSAKLPFKLNYETLVNGGKACQ